MLMGKTYKRCMLFAFLFVNVLICYICVKWGVNLKLKQIASAYELQWKAFIQHQKVKEESAQILRDVKHNLKNYLVSILIYAEHNACEEIIRFVNEILENGGMKPSAVASSGNLVVDALIGYYHEEAKQMGIEFTVDVCIPVEIPFQDADICLILGNLLENAVEAAGKKKNEKIIKINIKYDKGNLLLLVMNNYEGQLIKKRNNRFRTTKSDVGEHGLGLASVRRAAAKYHGMVNVNDSVSGYFQVQVVLYGAQK